jgi:prephenate dehydratase
MQNYMQKKIKVAIQGLEGSFHHAAALKYFGKNADIFVCSSFREVVRRTANQKEIYAGVMAIENSTAGSILPNYQLLERNPVQIVGELNLRINQNLLVNRGAQLKDIKEVHSHPMALQQCSEFLTQYNWKLIESQDTAFSATFVKNTRSKHIACIAGDFAAKLFDLEIIKRGIQSEKYNLTRFLILQKDYQAVVDGSENKASILFCVHHVKGALYQILNVLARLDINLSKLQSVAIPGSHFNYSFHADLEFNNLDQFENAIRKIRPKTTKLKIYGLYSRSEKSFRA